jgi:hypothetical protein
MDNQRVWTDRIASSKPGKSYRVTAFADGTFTCECAGYIINGVNRDNLRYRCRHIKEAITLPSVVAALEGVTTSRSREYGDMERTRAELRSQRMEAPDESRHEKELDI